ncbi:MAG: hypothetical protein IBX64_06245 [Actinobacteria bacterium]|nr:hypothetical protein [Actinomycetota bacterium]
MGREEYTGARVFPFERGGLVPSWLSRISWGSVVAGTAAAISIEFVILTTGILVTFSVATVTSFEALIGTSALIGLWILFGALLSFLFGGYIAAALAHARYSGDGVWHGLAVWSLAVAIAVMLSVFLVSLAVILGGIATAVTVGVLDRAIQVSPEQFQAAAGTVVTISGFLLLILVLSLLASLLGGWAGSGKLSRQEAIALEEEQHRGRPAA